MEITTVTGIVTVLDILSGETPAILTQEETLFRGNRRLFTQKVPVREAGLFTRLCAEVRPGDQIEATIITEWSEDRSDVYLADFARVSVSLAAEEPAVVK